MFYYYLTDSLTPLFHAKLLLYCSLYMVNGVTATSVMLKQIIVLSHIDNPAVAQHIQEQLIKAKRNLIALKGNTTEFNTWVQAQLNLLHSCD